MPARRKLTMRHLRRILRLQHEGTPTRDIVRVTGIARTTIQRALERSKAAGLVWPLAEDVTDETLEARLFASAGTRSSSGARKHPEPDWAELSRELKRPAVTMLILWEEYRKIWPEGYASNDYRKLIAAFKMTSSMSRKGDCWDNAVTETLFGSLKVERLHGLRFDTRRLAKDEVMDWIAFYNHRRLHSTLGYTSPMAFEQKWLARQISLAA